MVGNLLFVLVELITCILTLFYVNYYLSIHSDADAHEAGTKYLEYQMRVPEENQENNIILVHYKDYWTKKLLVLKDAEKDVQKWQTKLNQHEKKYDAIVPTQPMELDALVGDFTSEFDDELASDGDGDDGDEECGSKGRVECRRKGDDREGEGSGREFENDGDNNNTEDGEEDGEGGDEEEEEEQDKIMGNKEGEQDDDVGYNITDAVDPEYIHKLADNCSNDFII